MRDFIEANLQQAVGSHLTIEKMEVLSGGCINQATRVVTKQGDFFAKWNEGAAPDLFVREAEGLMALKKADSGLIIPEVIAYGAAKAGKPGFLILAYLPIGSRDTQRDEQLLGEGLAQIHRFTADRFGFPTNNYCGATLQKNSWKDHWPSFFVENRIRPIIQMCQNERGFDLTEMALLERFCDKLLERLPAKAEASLVHGDLWSGNFMHTQLGPALIDPAVCYADRVYEFSISRMFGGFSPTFWSAYQANHPLEQDWKERAEIYQSYHYLNHYYLFGGGYKWQALAIANTFV